MGFMNETIQKQLNHTTIREFKKIPLPHEIFNLLMEVARHTPTSNGLQAHSVIRITDPSAKKEIADICKQDYVARTPELIIFIVDQYRNSRIAREKGCSKDNSNDMDRFFQGFTDACLAAQNVVNAAESMDLGTVYFGSILNDSERICELLKLPELAFPVLGLGIGYPDQSPQLKPRLPVKLKVFENEYTVFDSYLDEIAGYDAEMTNYYDLRNANSRVDCFSDQVFSKISGANLKRQEILNVVKKQGFQI